MGQNCLPGSADIKTHLRVVAVDLLFNVLPIVCGSSVFVFVVLCITLCPF